MNTVEEYNKVTAEIDKEIEKILKENKQIEISKRTGICTAYLHEMIKGKKNFSYEKKIQILSKFS